MEHEKSYTQDEQRVADWMLARTQNQVGAGHDPIGFLLASYEQMHAQHTQAHSLVKLCEQFIQDQRISCAESVYQTDRVIENAYEFIEGVCAIVGYYEDPDLEDEE